MRTTYWHLLIGQKEPMRVCEKIVSWCKFAVQHLKIFILIGLTGDHIMVLPNQKWCWKTSNSQGLINILNYIIGWLIELNCEKNDILTLNVTCMMFNLLNAIAFAYIWQYNQWMVCFHSQAALVNTIFNNIANYGILHAIHIVNVYEYIGW